MQELERLNHKAILHRASWLISADGVSVQNGAVLEQDGTIIFAGAYNAARTHSPAGSVELDHGYAALMPALVNAHTHLELSFLKGKIPLPQEGFPSWVLKLFAERAAAPPGWERTSYSNGLRELMSTGTGLYADITNGGLLDVNLSSVTPTRQSFIEVLGFNCKSLSMALSNKSDHTLEQVLRKDPCSSLAVHSCYSTSPELICSAKEWCRSNGRPLSIHVAEHAEEMEFLQNGTGFCRDLLESLGKWASNWNPPKTSPVQYLDSLGVLDSNTLVVHAVHMAPEDWKTLGLRQCSVCFCPRSNHNLNAGRPDIDQAIKSGTCIALGTDSLASNSDLNLFAEAAYILDHYPGVRPEAVLTMITQGGANALHRGKQFGSLGPGKAAAILTVELPSSITPEQLIATVIHKGQEGACKWAHAARG